LRLLSRKRQTLGAGILNGILRSTVSGCHARCKAYRWRSPRRPQPRRAAEERRGLIRYLRPDFQNPTGQQQTSLPVGPTPQPDTPTATKKTAAAKKRDWPKTLSAQAGAVHTALAAFPTGATATDVAKTFGRATAQRVERIEEILETLATLGKARELDNDRYLAT
jgi:hypothetical protein